MALNAKFIRESASTGAYELSLHADDERLADGLTVLEVEEVLVLIRVVLHCFA